MDNSLFVQAAAGQIKRPATCLDNPLLRDACGVLMSQAPFIGQHLTHKARNQIAVGMALETSIARMEVTVFLSKQISVIKGYAHRML